jgi:hypothetical protein
MAAAAAGVAEGAGFTSVGGQGAGRKWDKLSNIPAVAAGERRTRSWGQHALNLE